MSTFIKTKSEDTSLIIVDNELYLSNNMEVEEGDNDEREILFQRQKGGKTLSVSIPSEKEPIVLNEYHFHLLKQFLNN